MKTDVHARSLPSNSRYPLVGIAVGLPFILVGMLLAKGSGPDSFLSLAFFGFGLLWGSIGVGQLKTGFAWRNLAEGNRGLHRSEAPIRFWFSVGIDLAFCGILWVMAFAQMMRH